MRFSLSGRAFPWSLEKIKSNANRSTKVTYYSYAYLVASQPRPEQCCPLVSLLGGHLVAGSYREDPHHGGRSSVVRGLPDKPSSCLPRLIGPMSPIQFYSCFISYSSKNQDFAERLHADLQDKGVRTWFDREDLKIGDIIRYGINEAIRVHDKLMLVLSENSIVSDWVEGEVEAALEREQREKRTVLFPLRLDDAVMETPIAWASHIRQTRHIGDFRGWENNTAYQIAFARLLRDLRAEESTSVTPA